MTKIFYLLNLLHIYEYRFHIRAVLDILFATLTLPRSVITEEYMCQMSSYEISIFSFNLSLVARGTI